MSDSIIFEQPLDKDNGDVIRVVVGVYKKRVYLGLRVWYKDESGNLAPGKNGLNVPIDDPALETALEVALDHTTNRRIARGKAAGEEELV